MRLDSIIVIYPFIWPCSFPSFGFWVRMLVGQEFSNLKIFRLVYSAHLCQPVLWTMRYYVLKISRAYCEFPTGRDECCHRRLLTLTLSCRDGNEYFAVERSNHVVWKQSVCCQFSAARTSLCSVLPGPVISSFVVSKNKRPTLRCLFTAAGANTCAMVKWLM